MNASDKDKLTRSVRRIEGRVSAHRKAADRARADGNKADMTYHYGARDEAQKILEMLRIEFNDELDVTNVRVKGKVL